jgi:hypothetical protein
MPHHNTFNDLRTAQWSPIGPGSIGSDPSRVTAVPEPSEAALFVVILLSLCVILFAGRKNRKSTLTPTAKRYGGNQ